MIWVLKIISFGGCETWKFSPIRKSQSFRWPAGRDHVGARQRNEPAKRARKNSRVPRHLLSKSDRDSSILLRKHSVLVLWGLWIWISSTHTSGVDLDEDGHFQSLNSRAPWYFKRNVWDWSWWRRSFSNSKIACALILWTRFFGGNLDEHCHFPWLKSRAPWYSKRNFWGRSWWKDWFSNN